jgi:trigger factor
VEVNISNRDGLDAVLSVKVTEADYKEDFEKSLKDYGRKMNVPGFRPGKVPNGLVKKLVGKDAKRELVEKFLQKNIQDYLDNNNIKLVLSPLSTYHAEDIDWLQNELEFSYDIGIRPDIKLDLKPLNKLPKYVVELSEEEVREDVEKLRKQAGKPVPTDKFVKGKDMYLAVKFTELDESGNPLDGGLDTTKRYNDSNIPETLAALLNGKENNSETVTKIAAILGPSELAEQFELDEASVKDLYPDFRLTVTSLMKIEVPAFNEDFFKGYFPDGNVTNAEEFYVEWKKIMEQYYASQAENVLVKEMKKSLLSSMNYDLPEQFIKKYFLLSYEVKDEAEVEDYEKKYHDFTEELKWLMLSDFIAEQNNIEIKEDDVIHYTMDMIRNELGRSGYYDVEDKNLRQYAIDYLTKENNFNRTSMALRDGKVFDWLLKEIEPKTEQISLKNFEELKNNQ